MGAKIEAAKFAAGLIGDVVDVALESSVGSVVAFGFRGALTLAGMAGSGSGSSMRTDPRAEKLQGYVAQGKFDEAISSLWEMDLSSEQRRQLETRIRAMETIAEYEGQLDTLIGAGAFDAAKGLVHLMKLPDEMARELISRIDDVETRVEKRKRILSEIDEKAAAGDVDGAIRMAETLGLPKDNHKKFVALIRDRARDIEKARKAFESKLEDIDRLLRKGKLQEAKTRIRELPIKEEAKKALLASLP